MNEEKMHLNINTNNSIGQNALPQNNVQIGTNNLHFNHGTHNHMPYHLNMNNNGMNQMNMFHQHMHQHQHDFSNPQVLYNYCLNYCHIRKSQYS